MKCMHLPQADGLAHAVDLVPFAPGGSAEDATRPIVAYDIVIQFLTDCGFENLDAERG